MMAAYLRERFRLGVFGPLALVIAAPASAAAFQPAGAGVDALVALLLLAEFRLWDDLADRDADRAAHPDRVLVRSASLRPFVAAVVALGSLNLTVAVTRDGTGVSLGAFCALHAALGAWYALRSRRTIAGDQLLLAKYPAFVLIVAGGRTLADPVTIGLAAAALYGAASVYELWHDPSSPAAMLPGGRP